MTEPAGSAVVETAVRVVAADAAAADLWQAIPAQPARDVLVWLPALGVAARNYQPFARELAARGLAVAVHEWRGIGSSDRRAGRHSDWGYRELLALDLPATLAAVRAAFPSARLWLGGHSLGGQIAALRAALDPGGQAGLILVASGAPYWRTFPWYRLIGLVVTIAPWIAALRGHFPGRRLGFGGNEARALIADWARSGRTGRYTVAGLEEDLERRLADLRLPLLALRLSQDWLAPQESLDWLLAKMPHSRPRCEQLRPVDLGGIAADHFAWMKSPAAIAERVAAFVDAAGRA
jgi:predicted alpha/beta hydrolase